MMGVGGWGDIQNSFFDFDEFSGLGARMGFKEM